MPTFEEMKKLLEDAVRDELIIRAIPCNQEAWEKSGWAKKKDV